MLIILLYVFIALTILYFGLKIYIAFVWSAASIDVYSSLSFEWEKYSNAVENVKNNKSENIQKILTSFEIRVLYFISQHRWVSVIELKRVLAELLLDFLVKNGKAEKCFKVDNAELICYEYIRKRPGGKSKRKNNFKLSSVRVFN